MWYEVKVKYVREFDGGSRKQLTSVYLVEAASLSEVDSVAMAGISKIIDVPFKIANVKQSRVARVFTSIGSTESGVGGMLVDLDERLEEATRQFDKLKTIDGLLNRADQLFMEFRNETEGYFRKSV